MANEGCGIRLDPGTWNERRDESVDACRREYPNISKSVSRSI